MFILIIPTTASLAVNVDRRLKQTKLWEDTLSELKCELFISHGYIFNILCIYKVEYLFTYNWLVIILHFVDSVYFVNSRSINSLKSEQ